MITVCILSVGAVSCSSSDTNAPTEPLDGAAIGSGDVTQDAIQKIGTVTSYSRYVNTDGGTELTSTIDATFRQYERELTDNEIAEIEAEKYWGTARGCTDSVRYHGEDVDIGVKPTIPQSISISAGQVLSVMTPTGSWPDVAYSDSSGYGTIYDFSDPLPKGSTINIPGSVFPQFENTLIPTPERLVDVNIKRTEQGRVMPDSVITWRAATDATNLIRIKLGVYSVEQESEEGTISYDYIVNCIVNDTGELNFPDSIQAKLRELTLTTDKYYMWRQTRGTVRRGDTLLWMVGSTQFEGF